MQKKTNYYSENEDMVWQIEKRLDWDGLFDLVSDEDKEALGTQTAEEYKQSWVDIVSAAGEFLGTEVAPNAEQVEKEDLVLQEDGNVKLSPTVEKNLAAMIEMGMAGLGVKTKNGGLGAPFLSDCILAELCSRACPSTYLHIVWFAPIAHIIEQFGSQELIDQFVPRIAAGEMSGSMALTEPGAGSDLSAMRTYGEIQEDGSYKIYGTKRFISNGSSEISLVLAKSSKEADGLKSLSLFLVERRIDGKFNFDVTKIEEKIGLHGSATCELQFEGSKGYLLGKEGEGFLYMLRLMNDARIATGLQGLGTMEASLQMAKKYADERETWGKPISQHEMIAEYLLDLETEVIGFRSLCYQAGLYRSMTYFAEEKIKRKDFKDEKEKASLEKKLAHYKKQVRKWTPLIKWYVGEKSFMHTRTNLQIHGGYGFTKEYRAEWLVRESLILSLYEGTSQIQALMAIKDILKDVIRNPVDFVEVAFGLKVAGLRESNQQKKKLLRCKQIVNSAIISLMMRLVKDNVRASLSEVNKTDVLKLVKILSRDVVKFENISTAMLHAERICEMKSLTAIGNCVVRDAEVDPSRTWIAERFLNKSLIRLQALKSEIELDDPVLAERIGPVSTNADTKQVAANSD